MGCRHVVHAPLVIDILPGRPRSLQRGHASIDQKGRSAFDNGIYAATWASPLSAPLARRRLMDSIARRSSALNSPFTLSSVPPFSTRYGRSSNAIPRSSRVIGVKVAFTQTVQALLVAHGEKPRKS
jgi:hypothetical protein